MNAQEFKSKYWKFHPKLYHIAYAITHNKEDSEDIVQAVYHKVWTKRVELENIKNPESFCVTLTKNKALDYLRMRKDESQIDHEVPSLMHSKLCLDSEVQMDQKELLNQVLHTIKNLPKKQQEILKLSAIDGISHQEIESITGESSANIRSLLSRARASIKRQFKQQKSIL